MRRAALLATCCAAVLAACGQPPDQGAGGAADEAPGDPSNARPQPAPDTGAQPAPSLETAPSVHPLRDPENRALLARARLTRAPVVVLRVVAQPQRTAEGIAALESLGGVLGASELSAGSLRVSMPTENVERAAALPAVVSVTIEQVPPRGLAPPSPPPPR